MAECYDPTALARYLPPEILQMIFTYLPAKSLMRCREVNTKWRAVVDSMSRNQRLWHQHCKEDFSSIYKVAHKKAQAGLGWFNLYRSLSFWRLLKDATGSHEDFCSGPKQDIRNFKILDNGIIGILKKGCIVYYDTKTLDLSHRPRILGEYAKYIETENVIVLLNSRLHLFVIRKVLKHETEMPSVTFQNVKLFALAGEQLYFVNLNDEIFVMYWRSKDLQANALLSTLRGIMTIGYSNGHLNVLTCTHEIFSIHKDNNCITRTDTLSPGFYFLQQLEKYQLHENIDWRIYFQWMYMWSQSIPVGLLKDVIVIKQYGNIYFVGSYSGILRIYNIPFAKEGLEIFNRKPMREFNFLEHSTAAAPWCPILNIDVIERNDGPTLFVALPQKLTVLKLNHKLGTKAFRRNTRPMLAEISELTEVQECDLETAGPSGN